MSTAKEKFEDYDGFVEKFKPKRTTDDCMTPANIYEVVADWVVRTYGIERDCMVRPFWPGGDYESFDYPDGCCVVDNPPFSMLSKIAAFYVSHDIRFFLFAPALVLFTYYRSMEWSGRCFVCANVSITYENGAKVPTAFLTNLDDEYEVRTDPELRRALFEADKLNVQKLTRYVPKYAYPDDVLTAAAAGILSKYGVDYKVRRGDCHFIRALDEQRKMHKGVYGGGLILSERAAAERAAAEIAAAERAAAERVGVTEWKLSDRELEIQRSLGASSVDKK